MPPIPKSHAPEGYRCPFCAIANGAEMPCVVAQSRGALAVVSLGQVRTNQGGLLVFPRAHFESILDAPEETLAACMTLAKRVAQALLASLRCEGVTLRQNNGPASGQDVWHFHLHVVPRWSNDHWGKQTPEFMPEPERARLAKVIRDALAPHG